MSDLNSNLVELIKKNKELRVELFAPVDSSKLTEFEKIYGKMPSPLKELYLETNGICSDKLVILPFFDNSDTKRTWDSIERANNFEKSRFSVESDILRDFLIFGDIGAGYGLMIHKATEKLWYEDIDGWYEIDIPLYDCILNLLLEK